MGHIARSALTGIIRRWSLCRPHVFWGAGVALAAVLFLTDSWDLAVVRGILGGIVLVTGAAIGAIVKRAIERGNELTAQVTAEQIHCGCLRLMADALLATQQNGDDPESATCGVPGLRAVGQ